MLGLNFRLQVAFELLPNVVVVVFLNVYVNEKLNSCTQQSGWSVYTVVYLLVLCYPYKGYRGEKQL